jgi:hypothetical protein
MKNIMWKGQLYETINLDTISNKKFYMELSKSVFL